MHLIASTLIVTRGRNWNACACCGKHLHPRERIFFLRRDGDLWCSVRCAETQKPLAIV
jgi:ribosomal protein L24E